MAEIDLTHQEVKIGDIPETPLIFGAGNLTGILSLGSRMNLSAISPETGYLGDANMGGDFGAELRYTGLSLGGKEFPL